MFSTVYAAANQRLQRASWTFAALIVGTGFLIARPAAAQTPKPADDTTYTLKRTYKAGDVDRYKLDYHMSLNIPQLGGDTEIIMQMVMKETTKEVKTDGTVVTEDLYEQGTVNLGGMEVDLTAQLPKLTITRSKMKLDVKAEGGNEMLTDQMVEMVKAMYQQQDAVYPTKPVKIGDSWKVEMNTPTPDGKTVKTTGNATLVDTEMLNGQKTLKIKYVIEAAEGQSDTKMHGETTSNVDIKSGKQLKVVSKTDGEAMGSKVSAKMTMTLMTGDDKKSGATTKIAPEKSDK